MASRARRGSLDSSLSSASTTELEAKKQSSSRLQDFIEADFEPEEVDSGMPSPKSISVVMDEYVSASFVGRSSYAKGDVLNAVTQFNEALGIELQTELDCLYDINLGFVSGLVRREVQNRMHDIPTHSNGHSCKNILNMLADIYIKASSESDKHPTKAKWYLKMGSALCVINEWEKAKQVYKEGINMCKDKKDLKAALKNLVKLEQITSAGDIPAEDKQTPVKPPPSPVKKRSPIGSPKLHRRKSGKILFRKRSKSVNSELHNKILLSPESTDGSQPPLGSLSALSRTSSIGQDSVRSNSIDASVLVSNGNGHIHIRRSDSNDDSIGSQTSLTHSDGLVQLREKRDNIRRLGLGKRNSFGQFFKRRPLPTLDPEEKQQWTDCFSVEGCAVASYQSMTTSAVTHMRRLAIEPIKRENRPSVATSDEGSPETPKRMTFEATPIKSLTIESDDSELDEYD